MANNHRVNLMVKVYRCPSFTLCFKYLTAVPEVAQTKASLKKHTDK